MTRRQRQLDQLRDLCRCGSVGHAIDLAFEHFAEFGRDDDIVVLLTEALAHATSPEIAGRRFLELRATSG